jgi:hypothetical protein
MAIAINTPLITVLRNLVTKILPVVFIVIELAVALNRIISAPLEKGKEVGYRRRHRVIPAEARPSVYAYGVRLLPFRAP